MLLRHLAAVFLTLSVACDTRVGGLVGVQPPASKIAFTTQPSSVQAGAAITPAVQVAVQNTNNQTVFSNAAITLQIVPGTGTAGAVLSGAAPQNAVNGVVNFTGLRIDLPGNGYQLLASAPGFASVASAAFNVTP